MKAIPSCILERILKTDISEGDIGEAVRNRFRAWTNDAFFMRFALIRNLR